MIQVVEIDGKYQDASEVQLGTLIENQENIGEMVAENQRAVTNEGEVVDEGESQQDENKDPKYDQPNGAKVGGEDENENGDDENHPMDD
ncbi:hypothetical protein CAEBREN_00711 [Caenorhabditis brenneri]|uniref:Uncharacterized protein n=1 Tax=Caenorhabditis brenneri TaxID=135651 RepID=G0ND34_CAEBE|nr:hypothetical protein CAEBREN_00711 [Caenorhabditis brenneri]